MKLGTENRTATILALVLFAIAIFLLVRMWTGAGRPAAAAAPATVQPDAALHPPTHARGRRPRARAGERETAPGVSLDPRLRLDLLKRSESTDYKGTGRNIFLAQADIPKPVESPIVQKPPPPPQPTGPPPPPPIPLKFFGFATGEGEPTRVFLGNGADVFVAGEGEIVNRRYKVMKIHRNSVEIEDVLGNNRQTIPLTAG